VTESVRDRIGGDTTCDLLRGGRRPRIDIWYWFGIIEVRGWAKARERTPAQANCNGLRNLPRGVGYRAGEGGQRLQIRSVIRIV
jgi:hypothetical protein